MTELKTKLTYYKRVVGEHLQGHSLPNWLVYTLCFLLGMCITSLASAEDAILNTEYGMFKGDHFSIAVVAVAVVAIVIAFFAYKGFVEWIHTMRRRNGNGHKYVLKEDFDKMVDNNRADHRMLFHKLHHLEVGVAKIAAKLGVDYQPLPPDESGKNE